MAGRHRRPPAWRRLLLRLRRSDRAARVAALQAEVSVLRATVAELRVELGAERAAHAQSAALADAFARSIAATTPPSSLAWVSMDLPVVAPAAEVAEVDEDTVEVDVVLELPEAALLDPKTARDTEVAAPAAQVDLTGEKTTSRRIA